MAALERMGLAHLAPGVARICPGGAQQWASLVRCECPANDHFCRMARKAVSLRRPFLEEFLDLKDGN